MTMMELLTIPGLDNGRSIRSFRTASKKRASHALCSQKAAMALMKSQSKKSSKKL